MYTSAPCNSNATSSESSSAPKRPRLSVVPEPRRTKTVTPPIKTEEEMQKQAKADKIRAKIALGYQQLRELGVIVEVRMYWVSVLGSLLTSLFLHHAYRVTKPNLSL